jgi:lysophospholipase L1-like esterase
MSNVTSSGQWNEATQKTLLSANTDIVTITIGGNDVGFGDVIWTCLLQASGQSGNCDDQITAAENQVTILGPSFATTYSQIASMATKPSARVLVAGYPHILPESVAGASFCSQYAFSGNQLQRIWNVTDALNMLIKTKAEAAGFEFVDVTNEFAGHQLCGGSSYFNDINTSHQEYTYHPNQLGQQAYFTAFKAKLLA